MALFRPSREPRGADPYLNWKIALFSLGAALGIAGMVRESTLLVGLGIGVLGIGVVLRILTNRRD